MLLFLGGVASAQEPGLTTTHGNNHEVNPGFEVVPEASNHKFWDGENRLLFSTVAALSAADFVATRSNLASGGRELNPVTRLFSGSTAGLAVNFTGETVSIVGLAYFLHRTGHHKLERITPMLNVASSAFAVAFDLSHR